MGRYPRLANLDRANLVSFFSSYRISADACIQRIIAQLCPASQRPDPNLPSEPPDGPVPPVSLGPPGMYASFDWEDLDALFPWLELRESENGNDVGAGTHRAGLGFAR